MNSRIEFVSEDRVTIKDCNHLQCITLECARPYARLRLIMLQGNSHHLDRPAVEVLRDACDCWLGDNSLAAFKPPVRPYTPREAAEHLGREFEWQHRYWYLDGVYSDWIRTSEDDDGKARELYYSAFAAEAKWRGDGQPCGVCEPAGATP